MKARNNVDDENFLRVTVTDRDKYPTCQDAADALGMKVSSFRVKVCTYRKRYPEVFADVPKYKPGKKVLTGKEMQSLLRKLQSGKRPKKSKRRA